LDKKGFIGIFDNWEADAILGLPEEKTMAKVPGERGEILWGFLNTARQTTGKRMMSSSSDRKVEKAGDTEVSPDFDQYSWTSIVTGVEVDDEVHLRLLERED